MLAVTEAEVYAEAVRLGLVTDGEDLPRHLRSQAVASLAAPVPPPAAADDEPAGGRSAGGPPDPDAVLTVYADGPVLLNGAPFPLFVAREPIEVVTRPDGQTTVRLTVVAGAVHLLPGAPGDGARTT